MITVRGLLASALLKGDAKSVEELIIKKIENLGEEAIMDLLGGTLVANVQRIGRAFETGGASEFERLRNKWLSGALPVSLKDKKTGPQRGGKWTHSQWAGSREDWLNNRWKHDWRSQPRNPATGRWIPGRLDYIASSLQYAGTKPGRTVRTFRRKRRARRAAARKMARQLMDRDN